MDNTDLFMNQLMGSSPPKTEMLNIQTLHPFKGHPYNVRDDAEMEMLIESIQTQGVLTPLLVRSLENGEYEVISGHRRLHARRQESRRFLPLFVL